MRSDKKKLLFFCFAALLLAAASIGIYRWVDSEQVEQAHYEQGETELIIVNTTGARFSLFRSGKTLADAEAVEQFDGSPIWLPAGSYFLKSEGDRISYYPVSIRGYRQGNQDDGSLAITVRGLPADPVLPTLSAHFQPVPSGDFLFGDRGNPAEPHYVWTQAFFITDLEVSNAEFQAFLDAPDGFADGTNWSTAGRDWKSNSSSQASARLAQSDPEHKRFGQADMPVTNVTWFEASAYCTWLTRKFGGGEWIFSLPSEAEWEKAARGPDDFNFGLGQTLSDAEIATYNWKKNPLAETTVMGAADSLQRYKPNRYGLFHMSGNVAEWTQSIYRPFSQNKPFADDDRNRNDAEGQRVVRGGSWYSASNALLYIAYRDAFQPELRHNDLGFRIVARRIP
jgi:formylglycine-generating enzyme required for sulfatase activity